MKTPAAERRIALLWGLAEASFFPIVPDVWLGWLVLERGFRSALRALPWAIVGALVGGLLSWQAGLHADWTWLPLATVPRLDAALLARVQAAQERLGAAAILLAPFAGVPYRLHAVVAASRGTLSLPVFLAVSPLARGLRFLLVTLLIRGLARRLEQAPWRAHRRALYLLGWGLFYLLYFACFNRHPAGA